MEVAFGRDLLEVKESAKCLSTGRAFVSERRAGQRRPVWLECREWGKNEVRRQGDRDVVGGGETGTCGSG